MLLTHSIQLVACSPSLQEINVHPSAETNLRQQAEAIAIHLLKMRQKVALPALMVLRLVTLFKVRGAKWQNALIVVQILGICNFYYLSSRMTGCIIAPNAK
jgi:hypothetical protein